MSTPANPFAILGVPERPDLDDETVRAAWREIAAATHPGREDGGDLARYTQATAAFRELNTPWGRSEAWADLAGQAWAEGRDDACPGWYPGGPLPGTPPLPPPPPAVPAEMPLEPVPISHIMALIGQVRARIRRGHPVRLLIHAAVFAGLCLAALALIPSPAWGGYAVLVLAGLFGVYAHGDLEPAGRWGQRARLRRGLGLQDGPGPRRSAGP